MLWIAQLFHKIWNMIFEQTIFYFNGIQIKFSTVILGSFIIMFIASMIHKAINTNGGDE